MSKNKLEKVDHALTEGAKPTIPESKNLVLPTSVVIKNENITVESLTRVFTKNNNLTHLVIQNSKLASGVVDVIIKLGTGLECFAMQYNSGIPEADTRRLADIVVHNKNLNTLSFKDNLTGHAGFAEILALPQSGSLKYLELSSASNENSLTVEEQATFGKSLTKFFTSLKDSNLEELRLGGIVINSSAAIGLWYGLVNNTKLDVIRINQAGLSAKDFAIILAGVIQNQSLTTIDLTGCLSSKSISEDYASVQITLGNFFTQWGEGKSNITTLHLDGLKPVSNIINSLSGAIAKRKDIMCLGLNNNDITDEGAEELAKGLRFAPKLKELYLENNKLGDKGFSSIIGALQGSTVIEEGIIREVVIGATGVTKESMSVLVDLLKGEQISSVGVDIPCVEGISTEDVADLADKLQPFRTSGKLQIDCPLLKNYLYKEKESSDSIAEELAALEITKTKEGSTDTVLPETEVAAIGGVEVTTATSSITMNDTDTGVSILGKVSLEM